MAHWLTTTTIASLALWACEPQTPTPPDAPGTPIASLARGAALFTRHCAICHGERGDGRGPRRTSLFRAPTDFRDAGWRRSKTHESVRAAIRTGVRGTDMPPWKRLGEPAIRDLAAYVLDLGDRG